MVYEIINRFNSRQILCILTSIFWSFLGKKGSKRIPRNDVFSGRLLWNPNGQWKDKWFFYQDGLLRGFKEVGFKPADVSIDVKACTLTQYDSNDMLRRLNIFKVSICRQTCNFIKKEILTLVFFVDSA